MLLISSWSSYGAVAIAWIWAGVRAFSDGVPMPPTLVLMAFWVKLAVAPFLLLPWQDAQYWA